MLGLGLGLGLVLDNLMVFTMGYNLTITIQATVEVEDPQRQITIRIAIDRIIIINPQPTLQMCDLKILPVGLTAVAITITVISIVASIAQIMGMDMDKFIIKTNIKVKATMKEVALVQRLPVHLQEPVFSALLVF